MAALNAALTGPVRSWWLRARSITEFNRKQFFTAFFPTDYLTEVKDQSHGAELL